MRLSGYTTSVQSRPGSTGNEKLCHTQEISGIGSSPSDAV